MRAQLEKGGVVGAGPTRKRGSGQVKKGGSLPRHIPILDIYVSTPPPPGILAKQPASLDPWPHPPTSASGISVLAKPYDSP